MRLRFDARARAILARLPVANVYSAAEMLLLAALAVQLARLAWVMVTPIAPLGGWQLAAPALPADPAALFASFDPFNRDGTAAGTAQTSGVTVALFGTRLDIGAGRGSAILAGPDGVQKSFAVGEEVAPGVVLKSVAFDHVTLDRGGVAQDLYLNPAEAPAPAGAAAGAPPGNGDASPAGVTAADLRADVAGTPRIEGGAISGVVLRGNGKGAFQAAGLRDGDVVTKIGDQPVSGPQDLDRLGMTNGPIPITVERDGRAVPMTLQVTK